MRVVTYATNLNNRYLNYLATKLDVAILPELIPWGGFWQGKYIHDFYAKSYSLNKFLEDIDPDEIIVVADAYDVLPLNGCNMVLLEKRINEVFDLNKVTFCAEENCFPEESLSTLYPKQSHRWKYLNAGLYAGRSKLVKQMLDLTLDKIQGSMDQLEFAKLFLAKNLIDLDYKCEIFQSLYHTNDLKINWDDYDINGNTIKNRVFHTHPLLFHGNGGVNISGLLGLL